MSIQKVLSLVLLIVGGTNCLSHVRADDDAPAKKKLPNVVMIVVDDLGWTGLGCYGSDFHKTPNIDRWAKKCAGFTNAYAASPVCTPTRASLMTGKHPARLHMTIWHEAAQHPPKHHKLIPPYAVESLPFAETTLAEHLQEAGYYTAHLGKWHLGTAEYYPENQGFDLNIGGTLWGAPVTFHYPYSGLFGRVQEPRFVPDLPFGKPGEYLTDRLTDEALKVLQQVKDQPFFMQLAYHTVHTPIEAKAEIEKQYVDKVDPNAHHHNPAFAGMMQSLDENVGRVLLKLDELNLTDNTVVIFVSDNGGFVNTHRGKTVTSNLPLRSGKGSLYEGGVRIPLLIRWPGVTDGLSPFVGSNTDPVLQIKVTSPLSQFAGRTIHEPVMTTDLFYTILDIVNRSAKGSADAPPPVTGPDGESLAKILNRQQSSLGRDELCFHYPHYYPSTPPVSSIRQGRWKLLHYYEDDRVELYNLAQDEEEQHDLAKSNPQQAEKLLKALNQWREDVGAQEPTMNPSWKQE